MRTARFKYAWEALREGAIGFAVAELFNRKRRYDVGKLIEWGEAAEKLTHRELAAELIPIRDSDKLNEREKAMMNEATLRLHDTGTLIERTR